ncbi:fumarylacetoacetate hydrolase family protein [uncultured Clostridium sp.]|uniref:fumarylacetoacetate hydrolase family protein n=1 Tax=uncultured Clostridium sp. TaxID=59620 RepID=UPI0028EBC632|nr:fumarylacetoacetate hydrolase family protein [uncultured Clostridium sp.]
MKKDTGIVIKKVIYNNDEIYVYLKDGDYYKIQGDIYKNHIFTREKLDMDKVEIVPPHNPKNIIGVGANYKRMIKEAEDFQKEPVIFLKPVTTVTYDFIPYPNLSSHVKAEVELGVIIGKECKNATEGESMSYVLGYTTSMDLTAVDRLNTSSVWNISKMFDGFTPLASFLVKDIDVSNLKVILKKNSQIIVDSSTEGMIFSIPHLISYISHIMTLMPGDIILTGTPADAVEINKGDQLHGEIEGIGKICTKVI